MRPKVGPAPIKPPWSTMTAYDLNTGNIMWQVPIGEVPELVAKGMRNTGSGAPRGAVVTAGGLIFTGTPDNTLRAFDRDTGKQLWEKKLDFNPMGVASTYEVAGRQYIVIAAAASATPAPPEAAAPASATQPAKEEQGAYLAFALPDPSRTSSGQQGRR
jgi:quinoprotein glucose dehydrogenase